MTPVRPRARREGLIVREIGRETVVYDLTRHWAFCLNPAAAAVFRRCDGQTDEAALARPLGADLQGPANPRLVRLAVDRLGEAGLLEDGWRRPRAVSSRRAVARLGLAALALPLVSSILVPTPAEAQTCISVPPFRCQASQCNQECAGGPFTCGSGSLRCRRLPAINQYACVPPAIGSCP